MYEMDIVAIVLGHVLLLWLNNAFKNIIPFLLINLFFLNMYTGENMCANGVL